MMKHVVIVLFLFLFHSIAAQSISSNLPIVKVVTENASEIFDEPKVKGEFRVIYNGESQVNRSDQTDYHFESTIEIEIRGESSQGFPKKSYLMELRDKSSRDLYGSFLNFPLGNEFILYAPYSDKTLMNNVLAMDISRKMGRYASRTRHVELFLNNEYQGVYVLMEKIRQGPYRVDIKDLDEYDTNPDDISGGYIFRIDKGEHPGWTSRYAKYNSSDKLRFQYFYPEISDLTTLQAFYLQTYVDGFEETVASFDFVNEEGKHLLDYINLRSFIDQFILNELSKNVDAYRLSSYFFKESNDKGGRIVSGPTWDYNLSFGNADYCEGDNTNGWIYYQCLGNSPFWWNKWFYSDLFANGLRCRWEELRSSYLSDDSLMEWIDSTANHLQMAADRNETRWQTFGNYVWPNPGYFISAPGYSEVIFQMKRFIRQRLQWMDQNMPGRLEDCEYYNQLESDQSRPVESDDRIPEISIFPNPATESVTISSDQRISVIEIYDIFGRFIDQQTVRDFSTTYLMDANMHSGQYIFVITTAQHLLKRIVLKL